MGAASSRPAPWASAVAASPHELTEPIAWSIATAWHPLLRTHMKLDSAFRPYGVHQKGELALPMHRVVQDVTLIDFSFEYADAKDLARVVLAARAAAIAWFALSCCLGYSSEENPGFWSRVFASHKLPLPSTLPLVDAWSREHCVPSYRFFPDLNRPFPCVRLTTRHDDVIRAVELLCLGNGSSKEDKLLVSALETLVPFIVKARWQRGDLPVVVLVSNIGRFQSWLPAWSRPCTTNKQLPTFRVTEVHCIYEHYTSPNAIDNILANTTVHIRFANSLDARGVFGRVGCVFEESRRCIEDPRVHIERLELCASLNRTPLYEYDYFSACCSLLPHTREVKSVSIDETQFALSAVHAAWLGYALFHPESAAKKTSCTALTLGLRTDYELVLRRLQSMAEGNNLWVALGATTNASSSYYQAKLRTGTRIRMAPNDRQAIEDRLDDRTTVYTCTCTSKVSVTVCYTGGPAPVTENIRVVFPGRGFAWVDTADIIEIIERAPSPSCVRRLRLVIPTTCDGEDELVRRNFLVAVLSLFGRQLEFLDIVNFHRKLPAATVLCVLELCPHLKSLRVRHDGSCWSSDNAVLLPDLPQLEELELAPDDRLVALEAPQLRSLRRFHIVNARPGCFLKNRTAFLPVLSLVPDLAFAVWQARPSHALIPMELMERRERELLGDGLVHGLHDVTRVPMTFAARLAFLSIVRQSSLLVGRLSPEIARLIFGFSSSFKPRAFHIRDYNS